MLAENPPIPTLTERQKEILLSVTRGLTNKDIAKQLDITVDCVKDHVNVILSKIGAASRAEAATVTILASALGCAVEDLLERRFNPRTRRMI